MAEAAASSASASRERREKRYEDGGGEGGFGKFRKRPFRGTTQKTPYDRPPTAIRNPSLASNCNNSNNNNRSNGGWLSRLVDPAQRLITASAHRLFASVFRKRLPPPPLPPPQPPEPEERQGAVDKQHEAVPTDLPGTRVTAVNGFDNPSNNSDISGVTELELILKGKTFTRSEIDHLTALLQSRTTDVHLGDDEKKSELLSSKVVLSQDRKEEFPKTPVKDNRIESHVVSTPVVNSSVLDEDVASPAELAKAYMGSRPSIGLHNQPLREDSAALINQSFPSKSSILSIVPRSSGHAGLPENGFVTPRSRVRSAIYSMARTPYSRVHPTSTLQGAGTATIAFGGPSSSSQSTWENNRFSGSKQGALKRRSSVLDNDIGSVGPIRRIRQKSNLLPTSGTFSLRGTGFGSDATQHTSSTAKPVLVGEPSVENGDNNLRGLGFSPVSSKSSEMASKILQQLDVLVSSRDKSPTKLSPSMLRGPALRSLDKIDSSKFLENVQDNNKLDAKHEITLPDAQHPTSQKQDKLEENGPTKSIVSCDNSVAAVNGVHSTSVTKNDMPDVKKTATVMKSVVQPPLQTKRAFQMSAHEDYLELDDDDHFNGTASPTLAEGRERLDTALAENKTGAGRAITVEKPPASTEVNPPAGSVFKDKTMGTHGGSLVAEKSSGIAFPAVTVPSMTVVQAVVASDKAVLPKDSNATPPIFSFGERVVLPKEPNGASLTSDSDLSGLKSSLDNKPESSSRFAFVATDATNSVTKEPESDKAENRSNLKAGVFSRSAETMPSALSTSLPPASIFSFGLPSTAPNLTNGSPAPTPSLFSSPSSPVFSNNITGQNSSSSPTNAIANSSSSATAITTTMSNPTGSSSLFMSASPPSSMAGPIFKFGPAVVSSTSSSLASAATGVESTEAKIKGTSFGNMTCTPFVGTSSANLSTGSSLFGGTSSTMKGTESSALGVTAPAITGTGQLPTSVVTSTGTTSFSFNAGAITSSDTNLSHGSNPFTAGSDQASAAGTFSTSTQSTPVHFSSAASSPSFGLTGNMAFSSGSSLFGSSTSASNMFNSVAPFGMSSSASSLDANSVSSSSSSASAVLGSSWQTSPSFGSAFNTSSSSTGFAFGTTSTSNTSTGSTPMMFGSTSAQSASMFPFSSPAVATPSQPPLGNSGPGFVFSGLSPSGNNDQMNMEDSMAEDTVQAAQPTVPIFGQQPMAPPSTGFIFGSTPQSGGNQFGSLASSISNPFQFTPAQNPSPFQSSSSLEFNAGGSFSLGSGGGDKSTRKFVKVKKSQRKR